MDRVADLTRSQLSFGSYPVAENGRTPRLRWMCLWAISTADPWGSPIGALLGKRLLYVFDEVVPGLDKLFDTLVLELDEYRIEVDTCVD
jgi:hypothetical protein